MPHTFAPILVRHHADLKTFDDEIHAAAGPVVLKGAVAHWRIVSAGRESPRAHADYIKRFDNGLQIPTLAMPASQGGRIFYRPDMSGFNFRRGFAGLGPTRDRPLELAGEPSPPALFIESLRTASRLPESGAAPDAGTARPAGATIAPTRPRGPRYPRARVPVRPGQTTGPKFESPETHCPACHRNAKIQGDSSP